MPYGSLFQIIEPAYEKDLRSKVFFFDRGYTKNAVSCYWTNGVVLMVYTFTRLWTGIQDQNLTRNCDKGKMACTVFSQTLAASGVNAKWE